MSYAGAIGFFVMLPCALGGHSGPMLLLMGLYLLRVTIFEHTAQSRRRHGGPRQHSRYPGHPLWGLFNKTADDKHLKKVRYAQVAVIVALGCLMWFVDHTVCIYLIASALASATVAETRETIERDKMLDHLDEEIEDEEFEKKLAAFRRSFQFSDGQATITIKPEFLYSNTPEDRRTVLALLAESPNIARSQEK